MRYAWRLFCIGLMGLILYELPDSSTGGQRIALISLFIFALNELTVPRLKE